MRESRGSRTHPERERKLRMFRSRVEKRLHPDGVKGGKERGRKQRETNIKTQKCDVRSMK